MVRREPSLIGLVAAEEVHFAEALSTCVVDDGGEQHGRGIPPAAIGEPGALIQAHPAGHLERRHGRDYQIVVPEFVDDHLIGRAATSEPGRETIEDRKEAGAASPLGLVELAQGVETLEDRPASDRLMRHAFGRDALGGDTEVPAEQRGQGGPVRFRAVGQWREGGHGHGLAAGRGSRLAFGQEAVMKGQLASGQVTADQQVMPGRGGAQPCPGVPALAFGSVSGRADFPATPAA